MAKRILVTIGREFGSGGRAIGEALAQQLNIRFFDKELLEVAASESGLSRDLFEHHDEKPVNSLLYSLSVNPYSLGNLAGAPEMPITQKLFLAQFDAVRRLAKDHDAVFVGRCADYALADEQHALNVFIHAPRETRIQTIAQREGITHSQAKDRIIRTDKQRAAYYNYYSDKKWGALQNYHLTLDSSLLGADGCVQMIAKMVELML